MGHNPERESPFFFAKPADAIVQNGVSVPYPSRTSDLHHEIELVAAIAKSGSHIRPEDANEHIFGYAVGVDLTRRDLQTAAKSAGRPWETGKSFDRSAPITAISPVADTGFVEAGRIWLSVNGAVRQEGDIADMIWSVAETIAALSELFALAPGDLIFTGTPAGVGRLEPGDLVEGGAAGLETLSFRIAD